MKSDVSKDHSTAGLKHEDSKLGHEKAEVQGKGNIKEEEVIKPLEKKVTKKKMEMPLNKKSSAMANNIPSEIKK